MSGEALLRGRYFSHMRRLGTVGLLATGLTGVATYYGVYKRRDSKMEAYKNSMTGDQLKAIDSRVHRFAGLSYNEEYPNIPMYELTTDTAKEGYEKFEKKVQQYMGFWHLLSSELKSEDPEINAAVAKLALAKFPGQVKVYTSPKDQKAVKEAEERVKKASDSYYNKHLECYLAYKKEFDTFKDEVKSWEHLSNDALNKRMDKSFLKYKALKEKTQNPVIQLMKVLYEGKGAN